MRTPALTLLALMTLLPARPDGAAAQQHPEIVVAADPSGRLVVFTSAEQPFPLPPSRFIGIDGYADAVPGFRSLDPTQQTAELRPLDPAAHLAFELVYTDPGLTVLNDHGTAPMRRRDFFRLGVPPFDTHPVWIIAGDMTRPRTVTLRIRDRAGGYDPSDAVSFRFVADATVDAYLCPLRCEGQKIYAAAGTCPVCGMRLKLASTAHYRADVTSAQPLRAGVATTLRIALHDPQGAAVQDLEPVHERLLHLFVISADLSWFAHGHPTRQPDGTFLLPITFPRPGRYTLFQDFTPARVGVQVVAVDLDVRGTPPASLPLEPDVTPVKTVEGYTVSLSTGGPLTALRDSTLTFSLERDGAPVRDLEPFLGALGHLVVVSQDRKHFVQSRPLERSGATAGPDVTFGCQFPAPGTYQAWGQFQRQGRVLTAPFTFRVLPAGATEKPAAEPSPDD